jgi:hypothetical protein
MGSPQRQYNSNFIIPEKYQWDKLFKEKDAVYI